MRLLRVWDIVCLFVSGCLRSLQLLLARRVAGCRGTAGMRGLARSAGRRGVEVRTMRIPVCTYVHACTHRVKRALA